MREAVGWCGGALASVVLGKAALDLMPFGPFARHMGEHIVLMNAAAPLLALAIVRAGRRKWAFASSGSLVVATLVQLTLLWGWHAPVALDIALSSPPVHALMQASLLAAALWFWFAVVSDRSAFRWRALFALLLTGKLFCLLGVLLVFAPRLLYGDPVYQHGHHVAEAGSALADQHLGGLMMLVVCPLTYVLAGVIIAAQWLRDLTRTNAAQDGATSDGVNILKMRS